MIYCMKRDTKKKILLLILSGVSLALTKSPRGYFKIIKGLRENWEEIKRRRLYEIVREFYNDRLVSYKENKDGLVEIVLTKDGEKKAIRFKLDDIKIKKPKKWDKQWRIVIFDIPNRFKKAREAMRKKLKELGFVKLQESVFVFPYECENEINFIVEVFQIRPFIRFIRASSITNEEQLMINFRLLD